MPSFVVHVTPSRLASTPAVTVAPLFPPQPTSITPSLGTLVLVLNSYVVDVGRTCAEGKRGVRLRAASRQCALGRAREQNTPPLVASSCCCSQALLSGEGGPRSDATEPPRARASFVSLVWCAASGLPSRGVSHAASGCCQPHGPAAPYQPSVGAPRACHPVPAPPRWTGTCTWRG